MSDDRPASARAAAFEPPGEFRAPALDRLIRVLSRLPGLGRKSATRMALHLIQNGRGGAEELTGAIAEALASVRNCSRCGAITETDPCGICTSPHRDDRELCVVATPVDVLPIERAGFFRGRYFVLGGLLSPMDGVLASDLPFAGLAARVRECGVNEVILALDASVEGETTALYIQRLLERDDLRLTHLATGIPVGAALEYTDEATLQRAFLHRRPF